MSDNHTWTPVQRPYVPSFLNSYTYRCMGVYRNVSPTSQIRAEVRMTSGRSFWAKHREASEVINLRALLSNYWSSNDRQFTILSKSLSPIDPRRSDCEEQRPSSSENIVGL